MGLGYRIKGKVWIKGKSSGLSDRVQGLGFKV